MLNPEESSSIRERLNIEQKLASLHGSFLKELLNIISSDEEPTRKRKIVRQLIEETKGPIRILYRKIFNQVDEALERSSKEYEHIRGDKEKILAFVLIKLQEFARKQGLTDKEWSENEVLKIARRWLKDVDIKEIYPGALLVIITSRFIRFLYKNRLIRQKSGWLGRMFPEISPVIILQKCGFSSLFKRFFRGIQSSESFKKTTTHEIMHFIFHQSRPFLRKYNSQYKSLENVYLRFIDEMNAYLPELDYYDLERYSIMAFSNLKELDEASSGFIREVIRAENEEASVEEFKSRRHKLVVIYNPESLERFLENLKSFIAECIRIAERRGVDKYDFIWSLFTSRNFKELVEKILIVAQVDSNERAKLLHTYFPANREGFDKIIYEDIRRDNI